MRIVAISDLHGGHENLKMPEGDVLVVAGDICFDGNIEDIGRFGEWTKTLDYKYKIIVAGNHDSSFATGCLAKEMVSAAKGNIYLEDNSVTIGGLKFHGSPWTPQYGTWSFMLPRGERIKRVWENVPDDTDILITHGPPKGFLDFVPDTDPREDPDTGCQDLLEEIIFRIHPKVHIFGHIHGEYGMKESHGCRFINVSSQKSHGLGWNDPTVFDIEHQGEIELEN